MDSNQEHKLQRESKWIWCLGPNGFHKIHFYEYTLINNSSQSTSDENDVEALICVHGLTRNGTDYDYVAESIIKDSKKFKYKRIVCPDVVGRGKSNWLSHKEDYGYPLYRSDMSHLIAAVSGGKKVDWIGTSMGGIIGMMIASQNNSPIRKLILNDIGAFAPKHGLLRIAGYAGKAPPIFNKLEDGVEYIKDILKPFGLRTEEEWIHLAKRTFRKTKENFFEFLYDPNIGYPMSNSENIHDLKLWTFWDNIKCPVMLIRGVESDILLSETVQEMKTRGPGLESVVEFEKIGHAPLLFSDDQVDPIKAFLLK